MPTCCRFLFNSYAKSHLTCSNIPQKTCATLLHQKGTAPSQSPASGPQVRSRAESVVQRRGVRKLDCCRASCGAAPPHDPSNLKKNTISMGEIIGDERCSEIEPTLLGVLTSHIVQLKTAEFPMVSLHLQQNGPGMSRAISISSSFLTHLPPLRPDHLQHGRADVASRPCWDGAHPWPTAQQSPLKKRRKPQPISTNHMLTYEKLMEALHV